VGFFNSFIAGLLLWNKGASSHLKNIQHVSYRRDVGGGEALLIGGGEALLIDLHV
jgi:hypothetical protein